MTPVARERYQANGASIASSRVLVDSERLMGLAWATWNGADEAKRELLVGFSPELLALGVHGALQLREATGTADNEGHNDKVARVATEREVAAIAGKTLALRDQAIVVLKLLVVDEHTLAARLETSVGNANTPSDLAAATERLAALGKELGRQQAQLVLAGLSAQAARSLRPSRAQRCAAPPTRRARYRPPPYRRPRA